MLPIAIGALVLLAAAVVVWAIGRSDVDEEQLEGRTVATAPASVPTARPSQPPQSGVAGEQAAGSQPVLRAQRTALLPVPDGGLGRFDGATAVGSRLVVVDVAPDTGFFAGRREGDPERVYVEYGARADDAQGSYAAKANDRVALRGEVRRAPEDPGSALRLDASRAREVERARGYVTAQTVTPQGSRTGGEGGSGAGGEATPQSGDYP